MSRMAWRPCIFTYFILSVCHCIYMEFRCVAVKLQYCIYNCNCKWDYISINTCSQRYVQKRWSYFKYKYSSILLLLLLLLLLPLSVFLNTVFLYHCHENEILKISTATVTTMSLFFWFVTKSKHISAESIFWIENKWQHLERKCEPYWNRSACVRMLSHTHTLSLPLFRI